MGRILSSGRSSASPSDLVEGYRYVAANRRSYHEALIARPQRLAERHGLAWRV